MNVYRDSVQKPSRWVLVKRKRENTERKEAGSARYKTMIVGHLSCQLDSQRLQQPPQHSATGLLYSSCILLFITPLSLTTSHRGSSLKANTKYS